MDIARRLGILVFFMVPAIVGGGIVYHMFDSMTAILIYETILIFIAGGLVTR